MKDNIQAGNKSILMLHFCATEKPEVSFLFCTKKTYIYFIFVKKLTKLMVDYSDFKWYLKYITIDSRIFCASQPVSDLQPDVFCHLTAGAACEAIFIVSADKTP